MAPLKFERLRALCEDLDPLALRLTQPSKARLELRLYILDLDSQERCFRRECARQLNLPSRRQPVVSQRESSADTQPSTRRGRPQPAAQSQVGATTAAEALRGLIVRRSYSLGWDSRSRDKDISSQKLFGFWRWLRTRSHRLGLCDWGQRGRPMGKSD